MKTQKIIIITIIVGILLADRLYCQEPFSIKSIIDSLNEKEYVIDINNPSLKLDLESGVFLYKIKETDDIIIYYPLFREHIETIPVSLMSEEYSGFYICSKKRSKSVLLSFKGGLFLQRSSKEKFTLFFDLKIENLDFDYYFFDELYRLEYIGRFVIKSSRIVDDMPEGVSYMCIYDFINTTKRTYEIQQNYTEINLDNLFSEVYDKNDKKSVSVDESEIAKRLDFLPNWIPVKR